MSGKNSSIPDKILKNAEIKALRMLKQELLPELINFELGKNLPPKKIRSCLPSWPDDRYAAPNEVLRSALFTARNNRVERAGYMGKEIYAIGKELTIKYTGLELRQTDADVYFGLIQLARKTQTEKVLVKEEDPENKKIIEKEKLCLNLINFKASSFLKMIGWPRTGYYITKLNKTLDALKATSMSIEMKRNGRHITIRISLLNYLRYDHNSKIWTVGLPAELIMLFGGNGKNASHINRDIRKQLSSPLEKWLQGYYSTHRDPYPISEESLMKAAGVKFKQITDFRKALIRALEKLVEVGFFANYKIKNGIITVEKHQKKCVS